MSALYVALSIADGGATGSLHGCARVVVVTSEHGAVSNQDKGRKDVHDEYILCW